MDRFGVDGHTSRDALRFIGRSSWVDDNKNDVEGGKASRDNLLGARL